MGRRRNIAEMMGVSFRIPTALGVKLGQLASEHGISLRELGRRAFIDLIQRWEVPGIDPMRYDPNSVESELPAKNETEVDEIKKLEDERAELMQPSQYQAEPGYSQRKRGHTPSITSPKSVPKM